MSKLFDPTDISAFFDAKMVAQRAVAIAQTQLGALAAAAQAMGALPSWAARLDE